jgi:hypothetical protein
MVFLTESPRVPLNLAWTWVLSVPLQERPDGVLLPGPIEADIAAGGRLSVMIGVLDRAKPVTADVVVSPVLVSQLARMSKGYRSVNAAGVVTEVPAGTGGAANATRVLEELRSVARRSATELSATPFGDARIPAILKAGLGKDLTSLLDRGRTEVGSALGVTPSPGELRPPQSQLDPASLGQVVARGAKTLLVDPDFVPPPAGLQFSPPSVALVAFGSRSATAILPDTGVATVAQTYPQDPVLAECSQNRSEITLAERYREIDALYEIGPVVAASIRQWFDEPHNRELVARLARAGVNVEPATGRIERTY